ncbi:(d)CMP kinase [Geojedonia litorea]|uniref:Cytidylate kinase n=1 Tax=Geojedonia litorea TaxID=1268269 RepID=A0ABV9N3J8_9FLAO
MNKITIAIDGYSSTGKSTVAKQLAKALGYVYVDTGAMYRAVTLFSMQNNLISEHHFNKNELISLLDKVEVSFQFNEALGYAEVYLNGANVENTVRSLEVSQFVSQIAAVSEVRQQLVKQQQQLGKNKGVVMDGRDIGTVVFPDAELKVFMTASPDTRAERRYKELLNKGEDINYDDVLENVKSRDYLDSTREDSPLIKAHDAIEIDNSNLSLEQQFQTVFKLAKAAIDMKNKKAT